MQIQTCLTHACTHSCPQTQWRTLDAVKPMFVCFSIFLFLMYFFYVLVWIHCNVIYSLLSVVIRYLWIYCCNFRQKLNISKTCLPHVDFFHYLMCSNLWNQHCCSFKSPELDFRSSGYQHLKILYWADRYKHYKIPTPVFFFDQCLVKCFKTKEIEVIHGYLFFQYQELHNEI